MNEASACNPAQRCPRFSRQAWLTLGILLATNTWPLAGETMRVFAAASLTDVLRELGTNFTAQSHIQPVFNFAASSTLARQLEAGAQADLFFSADQASMDRLEKRHLLRPRSRTNILSNRLVVVAPHEFARGFDMRSLDDLTNSAVTRLAIGEPTSVPAGIYARKSLEKAGLWNVLQPKIIPTLNVRAALAAAESGNVEAAIVYQTDAARSTAAQTLYLIPSNGTPPIVYPMALLQTSRNPAAASAFRQFLLSPAAGRIFQRHGFGFLPASLLSVESTTTAP